MSHESSLNKPPQDRRTARRRVGDAGEDAAVIYLQRHGFAILGRNIARKTGELDIVAGLGRILHAVEVKTIACEELPVPERAGKRLKKGGAYDPSENLHGLKLRKIIRTAEWYVAESNWEGEWQIDAILVWRRARDGRCRVRYLPQIL